MLYFSHPLSVYATVVKVVRKSWHPLPLCQTGSLCQLSEIENYMTRLLNHHVVYFCVNGHLFIRKFIFWLYLNEYSLLLLLPFFLFPVCFTHVTFSFCCIPSLFQLPHTSYISLVAILHLDKPYLYTAFSLQLSLLPFPF